MAENTLYFGDNLKILRENVRDENVDLITPAEPTRSMKEEAAAFGFYESLGTTVLPKLQILTIKGLLDGTKAARYPDLTRGGLTFKKAKKEKTEEQLTFGKDEPAF